MKTKNGRLPNDVIFLRPVRYAGEKMSRSKVRMLYTDAAGKVYAAMMNRSVYDIALEGAAGMKRGRKPFATIGLETAPGRFLPAAVEISANEVWALQRILEHAMKSGQLPDILKSYIKPIIKRGEDIRESVISEKRKRPAGAPAVSSRVLEKLPYYPETDIELSMPIYKAEYKYPLLLLKPLTPDEQTPPDAQRLLVLDSDGDVAVIKVPMRLMRRIEIELAERSDINRQLTTILVSQGEDGPVLTLMPINRLQKKGLDAITRHFEATGNKKLPVSPAVKKVIDQARGKPGSSQQ